MLGHLKIQLFRTKYEISRRSFLLLKFIKNLRQKMSKFVTCRAKEQEKISTKIIKNGHSLVGTTSTVRGRIREESIRSTSSLSYECCANSGLYSGIPNKIWLIINIKWVKFNFLINFLESKISVKIKAIYNDFVVCKLLD